MKTNKKIKTKDNWSFINLDTKIIQNDGFCKKYLKIFLIPIIK